MKKTLSFIICLQIFIKTVAVDVVTPINTFGLELLKYLPPDSNMMISPFSISTAIAMLNAGAAQNTKDQIDAAFGWSGIVDTSGEYKNFLDKVNDTTNNKFVLNSKNKMYTDLTFTPLQAYTNMLRNNFGAEVEAVNFSVDSNSATVTQINNWVEENTNGKIKKMLSSVSLNTRAILINTIYFKASWMFPFTSITQEEFFLDKEYAVKTDTMHVEEDLYYFSNSDVELVKFPYQAGNSKLSMVVIKPKSRAGLSDVEKKIQYKFSEVDSWMQAAELKALKVSMPKFKFESRVDDLVDILQNHFDVTDVFDPSKADLSGISSTEGLFVSSIVHQSFVAVDENGTEAAAATAISVGITSVQEPVEKQIVLINQPFMFIICDESNSMVLFSGRMVVPDQSVTTAKYLESRYTSSASGVVYAWVLGITILSHFWL